jgi:hypothetical protein
MNDPEALRIRGYLQAQAAKLTIPQLVEKVRADLENVRGALESVPGDRFNERPAEGEWAANEVAAHLAETSVGVARGIGAAIDGRHPENVDDRVRSTADQKSSSGWWEQLSSEREKLFTRVLQAKGDEHLDVKWSHPMFGDLNWREWLLFTRIHDLDHARQVQAIAEEFK